MSQRPQVSRIIIVIVIVLTISNLSKIVKKTFFRYQFFRYRFRYHQKNEKFPVPGIPGTGTSHSAVPWGAALLKPIRVQFCRSLLCAPLQTLYPVPFYWLINVSFRKKSALSPFGGAYIPIIKIVLAYISTRAQTTLPFLSWPWLIISTAKPLRKSIATPAWACSSGVQEARRPEDQSCL